MDYISVKAASEKFGVTPRWIQRLCEDGRIENAVKLEGSGIWLIPKDVQPVSQRRRRNSVTVEISGK